MSNYFEKVSEASLPVVVLRDAIPLPSVNTSFTVSDKISIAAANAAVKPAARVFLVAQKEHTDGEPTADSLYSVGTVAKIKHSVLTPDGNLQILVTLGSRATVRTWRQADDHLVADLIIKNVYLDQSDITAQAYMREALSAMQKVHKFLPGVSSETVAFIKSLSDPSMLADYIAYNFLMKDGDKQQILEEIRPIERLALLTLLLEQEAELLACEVKIHTKVQEHLNRERRDYYLREQIRVIEDELGEGENENEEFYNKILDAHLPQEVTDKLLKENDRLSKVPFASAEAGVIRAYLETCLELPWTKTTKERANVAAAQKILNADHDGLESVKQRILEFIAVKQLSPALKSQIICLVGPPGTGKTSVAASIAKATGRKYVRVSLGGVRDEADIRGHRKTYIGAMPGRIINALAQAKVRNPLILLDEIDKLTRDAHGDPSSALLEVLDPEQNKTFRDHFIELPFDLSDCLFITTANTLDTIPRPLLDRMEVIELHTYTPAEKLSIAKHHLLGKQLSRHGLNRRMLKITDAAIVEVIAGYTREAGVRNLERKLAALCRKAAKKIVTEGVNKVTIDAGDVATYLGVRKFNGERISAEDEVGVVNGLAYTEVGGDMLKIEVAILPGTGKIELTGSLGDVMKESAHIAVSYVRSVADKYGIPSDFYKTKDIHIHAPEGAVPKDGPSAGVTMITALVSALSEKAVRHDVAMTGEVTLRGRVLAIGGLKEKTLAAYNAGVKTVIIPKENEPDLEEIDPTVRQSLEFISVSHVCQVLDEALVCENKPLDIKSTAKASAPVIDNIPHIKPIQNTTINGEHHGA